MAANAYRDSPLSSGGRDLRSTHPGELITGRAAWVATFLKLAGECVSVGKHGYACPDIFGASMPGRATIARHSGAMADPIGSSVAIGLRRRWRTWDWLIHLCARARSCGIVRRGSWSADAVRHRLPALC